MKRILKGTLPVIMAGVICFSTACSGSKDYGKYEDVTNKAPDASFSFETTLNERQLYPLSTGGKTYYVASNGSDQNDGLSEDKPITIAKLQEILSTIEVDEDGNPIKPLVAGDSVLFKKGDYIEGAMYVNNLQGTADNPITFASYGEGDERPHIHGDNSSSYGRRRRW